MMLKRVWEFLDAPQLFLSEPQFLSEPYKNFKYGHFFSESYFCLLFPELPSSFSPPSAAATAATVTTAAVATVAAVYCCRRSYLLLL